MWDGFGRFCREALEMEPLTLVRAYGLQRDDPAAEVLAIYPDAKPDEAEAGRWAEQWCRGWDRRFDGGWRELQLLGFNQRQLAYEPSKFRNSMTCSGVSVYRSPSDVR
jgi:hypothetical protein